MSEKKKQHPAVKAQLHPRNKHRERYDFKTLIKTCPELAPFVKPNAYNDESVDFFDENAVKKLNKALLQHFYNVSFWEIPQGYLCPPIPGRADYIHHMADVLSSKNDAIIPIGKNIKCLDIGTGANLIYPIIGHREYGWSFVGSDIDPKAIQSAQQIIINNPSFKDNIHLRLQKNAKDIFKGMILINEFFDLTICNPPFHTSAKEAQTSAIRKLSNLKHQKIIDPKLNFGGQNNELWCHGGEVRFINDMMYQSRQFATSCFWFSTLVSKETTLKPILSTLKLIEAKEVKTIKMSQGNKISRIVVWTFLTPEQQNHWIQTRWK